MELIGDWLAAAGQNPLVLASILALCTFILEDAAIVSGALLAADGTLPVPYAVAGLYAGIVLGDLGLYGFGWLAARHRWVRQRLERRGLSKVGTWLGDRLVLSVITARFIPGMRLPTYTGCGLFGLSFRRFALAVVGIVGVWTLALFFGVYYVGEALMAQLGPWKWVAAAALVAALVLGPRLIKRLLGRRRGPAGGDRDSDTGGDREKASPQTRMGGAS